MLASEDTAERASTLERVDTRERIGAVLVAAGRSTRMGFDKLWTGLGGRPVLAWSLEALGRWGLLTRLAVVVTPERADAARALVAELVPASLPTIVVNGGERRRDSVLAGLAALEGCTWALIHDAARPFLGVAMLCRGLEAARETGATVAALPARDTIKRVEGRIVVETPPRASLWTVQTPQVFRHDLVMRALAATVDDATDEAALVEQIGGRVTVFDGEVTAFKITTPDDLRMARALLALRDERAAL
ncbi:MAG: 2-C-methyl-D-erythritol 4-phosphate cytidylyltransferase [Chloroflexi bacterium]|nr:2-C-methyl-D-erythritol 4-phosphate cytidylyltransferase [Chloroflexota bacterium]